jgi:hypothetical protein
LTLTVAESLEGRLQEYAPEFERALAIGVQLAPESVLEEMEIGLEPRWASEALHVIGWDVPPSKAWPPVKLVRVTTGGVVSRVTEFELVTALETFPAESRSQIVIDFEFSAEETTTLEGSVEEETQVPAQSGKFVEFSSQQYSVNVPVSAP